MINRRDFLAATLALPFFPQTSNARLVGTVPLGTAGGGRVAPLGRLLGNGLDARQFTDLSTIRPDDPSTLVTPNDRFYIRTAVPAEIASARPFDKLRASGIDVAALEKSAVRVGPWVMECAGNADPANFGLLSAATWEGIPLPAILDRLPKPAPHARVLVTGVDDPGPSRTSTPGASWIFTRDELAHALLASRMNDAPLPRHHGAPMRLSVPGWYGCACIKWIDAIAFVPDTAEATSQMQEFAERTHQPFDAPGRMRSLLARDYEPPAIDTAAIPVRVEQWVVNRRVEYRIVGIIWGGTKPTSALSIRFKAGGPWTKVDHCTPQASTLTWSTWTHTWRPDAPGRYQIVLRVDDPSIRTRRLDLFFYVREIDIAEV
ncbi:MAG TPA: molybdopterin-dependent oxidoreductase [Vicinamibacterales bacterium]|nr:molybdopterin-dependent oxidoreductase [Vicinamibacterales bacterium]